MHPVGLNLRRVLIATIVWVTLGSATFGISAGASTTSATSTSATAAVTRATPYITTYTLADPSGCNSLTSANRGTPLSLANGPGGAIWFTDPCGNAIGRLTSTGTLRYYTTSFIDDPRDIAAGPDGNLWFTNYLGNSIGRLTPQGLFTEFTSSGIASPWDIVAGPDGALWFTNSNNLDDSIGRITTTGAMRFFKGSGIIYPTLLTVGASGDLWFVDTDASNTIGQMTLTGTVTTYSGHGLANPESLAAAPDGYIWVGNDSGQGLERIAPTGTVTNFLPSGPGFPDAVEGVTPTGVIWFTGDGLGRLLPTGQVDGDRFILSNVRQVSRSLTAIGGGLWFASRWNSISPLTFKYFRLPLDRGPTTALPAPMTVTVNGFANNYTEAPTGSSAQPTWSAQIANTLYLISSLVCLRANSQPVTQITVPGTYPITATSCSGVSVPPYPIHYAGGTFSVHTTIPIEILVSGSEVQGSAPVWTLTSYTGRAFAPGFQSTTSCSHLTTGSPVSSTLPPGTYVVTATSCRTTSTTPQVATAFYKFIGGTFSVSKSATTLLTITVDVGNFAGVYGDSPTWRAITPPATVTGTVACTDAILDGTVTAAPVLVTAALPAGTYIPLASSCSGLSSPTHVVLYAGVPFTIAPASLTVNAEDQVMTVGGTFPPFTTNITGFVLGQNATTGRVTGSASCSTTTEAKTTPGTYPIICTMGSLSATNYRFTTFIPGTLSSRAITHPLTVTADDASMKFGASVPTLSATVTGFLEGQNATTAGLSGSASCSTTATSISPVGTYPITCSAGTLTDPGYTFTSFIAGTLSVTATVVVTGNREGTTIVKNGQVLYVGPGADIAGRVKIDRGAAIDVEGGKIARAVVIKGAISARICGAILAASIRIRSTSGEVVVGDDEGPACAGNTIGGSVTIRRNTDGVEFDYNTIAGKTVIQRNTGTVPAPDVGSVVVVGNRFAGSTRIQ